MWETQESVHLFSCLNKIVLITHKYGESQWGLANNFAIKCTYCKCLEVVSSTIKYLACVIWSVQERPFIWYGPSAGMLGVEGNSLSVSVWKLGLVWPRQQDRDEMQGQWRDRSFHVDHLMIISGPDSYLPALLYFKSIFAPLKLRPPLHDAQKSLPVQRDKPAASSPCSLFSFLPLLSLFSLFPSPFPSFLPFSSVHGHVSPRI